MKTKLALFMLLACLFSGCATTTSTITIQPVEYDINVEFNQPDTIPTR